MRFLAFALAALGSLHSATSPAVPPPPPSVKQSAVAKELVRVFKAKDVEGYGALLADDVEVFEDGRQVASSKEEWLGKFGKKLAAEGVRFDLSPGYIGAGKILFIEYFGSHASWGTALPLDCCERYDAVAYDLRGGTIAVIRRLEGGSIKLDGNGARTDDLK